MQVETEREQVLETTADILPWRNPRVLRRYRLRRIADKAVLLATIVAVVAVLFPLLDILFMFFYQGALAVSIPRLTGLQNGLAGSIFGTLLLVSISTAIAVPMGVLGGIFLAEFSEQDRLSKTYASIVRFVSDILSGIPSILLGYVGFLILVIDFGWGLSPLAGGVILSILMLPYVIKTTELSIRKVPLKLREAATALGATKTQMINRMSLPLALPGILTGIVLSMSIAMGETAPLLFTAGFSNYYPGGLANCPNCQVGYLTYVIYTFAKIPTQDSQNLAYLAAFLLISFAVVLNLTARIGLRRLSRI